MKILVTAGPTREPLDPVRFLSNRSSGKMGYAIAEAANAAGHEVRLISGPVALDRPKDVSVYPVVTAAEMLNAILDGFPWCDVLVMCAAVADWRPRVMASEKLKKREMSAVLELERTEDILERVSALKQEQVVVGFAAETENLEKEAQRKLTSKKLDMIVANDVSRADAGFEADTNAVMLITPSGVETLPLMSKREVADRIIEAIEAVRR
jgi:phosphopantothenoylcysteine decarboxylase/phosphopantothenate--cysteine ligase